MGPWTGAKQAVPDPASRPRLAHLRRWLWRPCPPDRLRHHCSMERTLLLPLGHGLRQDPHPHHRFRFRAPAYRLARLLLRPEHAHLALPRRCLHVLPPTQG